MLRGPQAWAGDTPGLVWQGSSWVPPSQDPVSPPCQNFDSEICGVVSDAVWDSREQQQQILQMAIVEHLYQQGMLSVAEELCQVTVTPPSGPDGAVQAGRTCLFCSFVCLLKIYLY